MEDTKEKVSKLSSEDETQVSGGYSLQEKRQGKDYQGSYERVEAKGFYCDVCHRAQKWKENVKKLIEDVGYRTEEVAKERLLIPFQGGHICVDCLKKIEEELGRKIL